MRHYALIAALFLSAGRLAAQPPASGDLPAASPQEQKTPAGDHFARLAEKHGLSRDDLMRMHQEGMSWNDIGCAAWIADHGKRPVSEVLDRHHAGDSWREIAKSYALDAAEMRRGARGFERDAKLAERSERREGRRDRMNPADHQHDQEHRGMMEERHDRDMRQERAHDQDQMGGPHR